MESTKDCWSALERMPLALIVDDPMPCVNPLYYFHLQVRKDPDPPYAKTIPVSFLERFVELTERHGVRGDFTVVPFPAGIGPISEGLPGFDDAELGRWLDLVRGRLTDRFDVHPEVLTHTLALDLEVRQMRDISEHEWMSEQDETTLTDYFAEAMGILKSVGLPSNGITQPCWFGGDQDAYARAILSAEKRVNGRKRTHYFLDVFTKLPAQVPYCRVADPGADEFVVSVPALFDGFWSANDGEPDVDTMVDGYLTRNGGSGWIPRLIEARRPVILCTHWQSLYGNGSLAGLRGLGELLRRIKQHVIGEAEWMKLSQIADLAIDAAAGGPRPAGRTG